MRGSPNLTAPSYRPMLIGSASLGDSLLATVQMSPTPTAIATTQIAALELAAAGEAQQVALVAARPRVQRDMARFTQALAAAETPAELLADPTALKVLLTANGLGDQLSDVALATRLLLADASWFGSPVHRPLDPRWLGVNKTYAFATKGLAMLRHPGVLAEMADGYAHALWRAGLDKTTPGLSNALDFLRRAATISNVGQVLGDPTFRAVVTTTLGVSEQAAAREQAIAARIDVTQFRNPAFVNRFTERYLVAARQAAARTTGRARPVAEPEVGLVV